MIAKDLREEYLFPSHVACPGYATPLIARQAFSTLGQNTNVIITASCLGTFISTFSPDRPH